MDNHGELRRTRLDRSNGESLVQEVAEKLLQAMERVHARLDQLEETLRGRSKDYYTVEEVAEATGRSAYTVRRWIHEGRITATRVDGTGPRGRLLIARSELAKLIGQAKGEHVPPVQAVNL